MLMKKMKDIKVVVEIVIFYRIAKKFMSMSLKPNSELTIVDIFFLTYLEEQKQMTYYKLVNILPYDSSFIAKRIKKLEELGLISKRQEDKRKILELTEEGLVARDECLGIKREFFEMLMKNGLSEDEIYNFFIVMKKFSKILTKEVEGRNI